MHCLACGILSLKTKKANEWRAKIKIKTTADLQVNISAYWENKKISFECQLPGPKNLQY